MWQPAVAVLEPLESRLSLRLGVLEESDLSKLSASLDKMNSNDLAVSDPPERTASRTVPTEVASAPQPPRPLVAAVEAAPTVVKPEPVLVRPTLAAKEDEKPANRTPLAMVMKPEPVSPKALLQKDAMDDSVDDSPEERVVNETKVAMNTPRDGESELATQNAEPILVVP